MLKQCGSLAVKVVGATREKTPDNDDVVHFRLEVVDPRTSPAEASLLAHQRCHGREVFGVGDANASPQWDPVYVTAALDESGDDGGATMTVVLCAVAADGAATATEVGRTEGLRLGGLVRMAASAAAAAGPSSSSCSTGGGGGGGSHVLVLPNVRPSDASSCRSITVDIRYVDLGPLMAEPCGVEECAYGCLPLGQLYVAAVRLARAKAAIAAAGSGAHPDAAVVTATRLRVNQALEATLATAPHRIAWERLTELDLSKNIVGDNGLPPLLAVVGQCRGLLSMDLSANALTLRSATLLANSLRRHSTLNSLAMDRNEFFEGAGEELARLLRTNRRITTCTVTGNAFSSYLVSRIARQLKVNITEREGMLFNPLGPAWAYLSAPEDVPQESWEAAFRVWALLVAHPPPQSSSGVADAAADGSRSADALSPEPQPSEAVTRRAMSTLPPAVIAASTVLGVSPMEPTIPLAVTAPLFSTVMGEVSRAINARYRDPGIRSIFSDACAVLLGAPAAQREQWYPTSFAKALLLPLRVLTVVPQQWSDAAKALAATGAAHFQAGVRPHHYETAREALQQALLRHIGEDIMTDTAQAAWVQVTALFVRLLLRGTNAVL